MQPREQDNSATSSDPAEARLQKAQQIVADALARRHGGETLTDEQIMASAPSLRTEIEAELRAADQMHRIFLAARKAGPIADPDGPQHWPTRVLTSADGAEAVRSVAIQGYTILHEISSGGQGTVFRATQDATGRPVAIKVIPGGLLTGSRHRARFDREASILAKLDHPNIVGILDRGRTDDGSLFLVMPFIDGETLDAYLDRTARGANPQVTKGLLRMFTDLTLAIAEAHRQGIIHRDLKPANIRIDKHGRPHVLDFGLARVQGAMGELVRDITMTGQIIGSLPWTSPEQVSHKTGEVDARTDVYALGVILYQFLTGEFPYPVIGSVREVLDNIAKAVPPAPSQAKRASARGVDAKLDAIALRALAKSPADRYPTAQELAEDLERYLAGKPLATPTAARPARRRTWVIALLLGAALLLATAATTVSVSWNTDTQVTLPSETNSIGMRLVRVPRGEFLMGSPEREVGRDASEKQHMVRIERDFLIATTEVTQKQYRAIMGNLPQGQTAFADNLPVHSVTWDEAAEFCRRLSEREGRKYRLPREAEWEYACRAVSRYTLPFSGGESLDDLGWYVGNSDGKLHHVAQKKPNGWGLYDMHGNVAEWCDGLERSLSDLVPLAERANGEKRTLRGGNSTSPADKCRSAVRSFQLGYTRRRDTGFRVVAE